MSVCECVYVCARAKGAKIPLNSLRVHTNRLRSSTYQPAPCRARTSFLCIADIMHILYYMHVCALHFFDFFVCKIFRWFGVCVYAVCVRFVDLFSRHISSTSSSSSSALSLWLWHGHGTRALAKKQIHKMQPMICLHYGWCTFIVGLNVLMAFVVMFDSAAANYSTCLSIALCRLSEIYVGCAIYKICFLNSYLRMLRRCERWTWYARQKSYIGSLPSEKSILDIWSQFVNEY